MPQVIKAVTSIIQQKLYRKPKITAAAEILFRVNKKSQKFPMNICV